MNFPFIEQRSPDLNPSLEDTAREFRDEMLNVFNFGTQGSRFSIPHDNADRKHPAIKIPTLLRYSTDTTKHFAAMRAIYGAPREFQIAESPEKWNPDHDADGDAVVLKHPDGSAEIYLTHQHTAPYMNGLRAALETQSKHLPALYIELKKDARNFWTMIYSYQNPDHGLMATEPDFLEAEYKRNKSSFGFGFDGFPERGLLLQFLWSPIQLTPDTYLNHYSQQLKPFIKPKEIKQVGNFTVFPFYFAARELAKSMNKSKPPVEPPNLFSTWDPIIYSLEKDGDREFNIVDIGRVKINGKTYYGYSGSDKALVEEPVLHLVSGAAPVLTPLRESA